MSAGTPPIGIAMIKSKKLAAAMKARHCGVQTSALNHTSCTYNGMIGKTLNTSLAVHFKYADFLGAVALFV